MKILKYILIPILFLVVFSCNRELDYDDLGFEAQMVLNGLIYQDSLIVINVSRTQSILESNKIFPFLDSAEVQLYENDIYIEDLVFDSIGTYHSTIRSKANTNYRIEARTDEIESASAEFGFKDLGTFSLTNISYEISDTVVTYDDITEDEIWYRLEHPEITDPIPSRDTALMLVKLNFDIVFTDDGDAENFYDYDSFGDFCKVYNSGYSNFENSIDLIRLVKDNSAYLSFRNSHDGDIFYPDGYGYNSSNGYRQGGYICDDLFNGQKVSLKLRTAYFTGALDPIEINLLSYPDEFIIFHTSGYRYIQANDNPFSQPTNVYTNIENGLGIVSAVSNSKHIINLTR